MQVRLTEELVERGHEVTLFASGDSKTDAMLVSSCANALRLCNSPRPDPNLACAALLEQVAARAHEFEIIHCHIEWCHLPLLRRLDKPFLTTVHGRLWRSPCVEETRPRAGLKRVGRRQK